MMLAMIPGTACLFLVSCIAVITIKPMAKKKQLKPGHSEYVRPKLNKPAGKSMTIQNEAITVKEFLERHTQGIFDPTVMKEGIYDDNPSHDQEPMARAKDRLELAEEALEAKRTVKKFEKDRTAYEQMQKAINDDKTTNKANASDQDADGDNERSEASENK